MKKLVTGLLKLLVIITLVWLMLTAWADSEGPKRVSTLGITGAATSALVVYDPDPFYNLDQQVCYSVAKVLADSGWDVTIATVSAARTLQPEPFTLYVFCSNTYNWAPDWAISRYIKTMPSIAGKDVVAITLGGGSTGRSQGILEALIKHRNGKLLGSKSFWLWRPNDESRMKESNVLVANDMAKSWMRETLRQHYAVKVKQFKSAP